MGTVWAYEQTATEGQSLKFNSDGTYEFLRLVLTSATMANMYLQTGTYTSTANQITGTPQKATCSGRDPVFTIGYAFEGNNLVISGPTGSIIYQPDTATASSNLAFTYGCFDSMGNFTKLPLGPVSN